MLFQALDFRRWHSFVTPGGTTAIPGDGKAHSATLEHSPYQF
jgi:hypothetical protein